MALKNKNCRGFTLVEALIGTALFVVVFMGIFTAYRFSLKVVEMSKNKIAATAIANSHIEIIRNLAYEDIGTVGAGLPEVAGILDSSETQIINNVEFTITTRVRYIIDPADGIGADDNCDWDYKKADINVSWGDSNQGAVDFSINIAPKNLVTEIQTCLDQPGGVLRVTVFDSAGIVVPSPKIEIYDSAGTNLIDSAIPLSGEYSFALETGAYRVVVSKNMYSVARTYGADEVAVPDSPNPVVLNGDLTPVSLLIDPAAEISIDAISPTGMDYFADAFDSQDHISVINNAQVAAGSLTLSGPIYPNNGYAFSEAIDPLDIVMWNEFTFNDNVPAGTGLTYQIFYYDGASWLPIPDLDLAGNSQGFTDSPVDMTGIDKDTYPELKIKANFSSTDPSLTPAVLDWELSRITNTGIAFGGAEFHLQGNKTIGEDSEGQPVYKYSQDLSLDSFGHIDLSNMDEDSYNFSIDPAGGLTLVSVDPAPQPVSTDAGSVASVKLYLQAQDSFLTTVYDDLTMVPIFSATITLSNETSGYSKTQYTNNNGQTYFGPLNNGVYNVSISASGYDNYSGTITILDNVVKTYGIHHQE